MATAAADAEWAAISKMRQASRPATSSVSKESSERVRTRPRGQATKLKTPRDEEPQHDDEDPLVVPTQHTASKAVDVMAARRHEDGTSRLTSLLGSAEDKLREQLLIASEKGKKHAVYLLLHQRVVDRDRCRGMRGYTPLHHAATRGHLDVLQLLVDFGWSVDACNDAMETALHLASFNGHVGIVEFLLDKGADANARSSDGETPLFYAARKHHDRVVRLLLRRECDLTIENRYGDVAQDEATSEKTQLEFAVGREDLERLYRRTCAKPHSCAETKKSPPAFRGEVTLSQKQREDVLAFLDLTSLCRASQVCYRWHRAGDSPALWRRLGVSRWELMLQTTVGIGGVSPMTLLGAGGGRLQLNTASLVGSVRNGRGDSGSTRRPSSCDYATSSSRGGGAVGFRDRRRLSTDFSSSRLFLGDRRRPQTARTAPARSSGWLPLK